MKTLIIRAHNGGWCVFWKCDGYTVFESYGKATAADYLSAYEKGWK